MKATVLAFQNGKTVLYPTDTVWGIGCDARNVRAVEKIIAIKNKPAGNGLIILVENLDQLKSYTTFDLDQLPNSNANRPTTYIIPGGQNLAHGVMGPNDSLAFRIPTDDFCNRLIRELKFPIVSTSANFHGSPTPKNFGAISKELKQRIDHSVPENEEFDQASMASQIIQVNVDGSTKIIRE